MARTALEVRLSAFEALYRAGWTDSPIGRALHTASSTVRKWRDEHGFPRNPRPSKVIDDEKAMELYLQGENDSQIGRKFGVDRTSIRSWRGRRGLPTKHPPEPGHSPDELRMARRMLRAGASKRQVADALGVPGEWGLEKVKRISRKMRGSAARGSGMNAEYIRRHVLADKTVWPRIERAIGKLPREVQEEAVADLYAAVLDGRVAVSQIEHQAPYFRNKAWSVFGSAFGARSLDAENEDGFSLGDLLDDPDALESLEAAAELAYEMDD